MSAHDQNDNPNRRKVLECMTWAGTGVPQLETFQGFNILRWNDQGLSLLAVSDLNQEELREFGAKFETAARATRAAG
jgi:hypothetical protein